jgi:hypothetical protein
MKTITHYEFHGDLAHMTPIYGHGPWWAVWGLDAALWLEGKAARLEQFFSRFIQEEP